MFLGYRDRVWERTTSTGTGDLFLIGSPGGDYQTFLQGFGGDAETDVAIYGSGLFEIRRVRFHASTNRIERNGHLWGSSTGLIIDFPIGEKQIICTPPGSLITSVFCPIPNAGAPPHILSAAQAVLANQAI